jgi:hypothetical protein
LPLTCLVSDIVEAISGGRQSRADDGRDAGQQAAYPAVFGHGCTAQTSLHSTARPKGAVGTAASPSNIAARTAKQSINPIATAVINLPPGSMADDPAVRFMALVAGIKAA